MRKIAQRPNLIVIVGLVAVGTLIAGFVVERLTGRDIQGAHVEDVETQAGKDLDFDGLFQLGVKQLRAGRAHAALSTLEEARRHRPRVPEVYINLGFAYLVLDVPDAARQAFEKAIDLRPEQANAYFGLAETFEKMGDLEMALGTMRSYLHLTPKDDPYRRRASSAVWEWQAALGRDPLQSGTAKSSNAPTTYVDEAASDDTDGVKRLTELRLERIDGGTDFLPRFAGKTLLLNVWATWCPPCREELPSLQRLSDQLDPSRFTVAGLSVDKDSDLVREYLRDVGVRYANYIDTDGAISGQVLDVDSLPQTLLIGPDGAIRARVVGLRHWDDPNLVSGISDGNPEVAVEALNDLTN